MGVRWKAQREAAAALEEVQKKLQEALSQMPAWEKEHREQVRDLGRQLTEFIVGHLMEALHAKYEKNIPVATYLKEIHKDIVEIVETRPLSRRKRWSLKRVVRQAVEV